MAEEIGVVLKAIDQFSSTLNDFNKKLTEIGDNQKKQADKMSGGFGNIKSAVMELLPTISALAVVNWAKGAIEDAEKFNESLRHLQSSLEAVGVDFAAKKGDILKWGEALQANTRFSDDQALTSLENLTKKTGDLTTAQKLSQLAMDLTVKYGGDLQDRVNSLGLAYIGNQRGILGLQKEFKGMLGDAKDGTEIFKKLSASVAGSAIAEDNLTSRTAKLTHEYEEQKKKIGQDLIPSAMSLTKAFEYAVVVFDDIVGADAIMYTALKTGLSGLVNVVKDGFGTILKIGQDAWNGIGEVAKKVLSGDFVGAYKSAGDAFNKMSSDAISGTNKIFKDMVTTGQQGTDSIKELLKGMGEEWDNVGKHATGALENIGGIVAKKTAEETKDTDNALKEQKRLYDKYQADIGGVFASNLEKTWKGQQGFTDFFKSTFDDMTDYALKKLAQIAGNALFNAVMSLLGIGTGGTTSGGSKGLLGLGGFLGIFASGGYIQDDGFAQLHKGEYVVPANQVNSNHQVTNNNNSAPNITINGYNKNPQELAQEIGLILQQNIRGRGQTPMTTS